MDESSDDSRLPERSRLSITIVGWKRSRECKYSRFPLGWKQLVGLSITNMDIQMELTIQSKYNYLSETCTKFTHISKHYMWSVEHIIQIPNIWIQIRPDTVTQQNHIKSN
jgi:hypothetical protein